MDTSLMKLNEHETVYFFERYYVDEQKDTKYLLPIEKCCLMSNRNYKRWPEKDDLKENKLAFFYETDTETIQQNDLIYLKNNESYLGVDKNDIKFQIDGENGVVLKYDVSLIYEYSQNRVVQSEDQSYKGRIIKNDDTYTSLMYCKIKIDDGGFVCNEYSYDGDVYRHLQMSNGKNEETVLVPDVSNLFDLKLECRKIIKNGKTYYVFVNYDTSIIDSYYYINENYKECADTSVDENGTGSKSLKTVQFTIQAFDSSIPDFSGTNFKYQVKFQPRYNDAVINGFNNKKVSLTYTELFPKKDNEDRKILSNLLNAYYKNAKKIIIDTNHINKYNPIGFCYVDGSLCIGVDENNNIITKKIIEHKKDTDTDTYTYTYTLKENQNQNQNFKTDSSYFNSNFLKDEMVSLDNLTYEAIYTEVDKTDIYILIYNLNNINLYSKDGWSNTDTSTIYYKEETYIPMKTKIEETEKIRALLDDCVKKYWLNMYNFDNNPYNVEQYITWSDDEVQSAETEEWKYKCFAQEKEINDPPTIYTTDYLLNWVIA